MNAGPATLREVVLWIARDPWDALGRRWNYKSAILSALFRGLLFFLTNLSAGPAAAVAALTTEFWFRFLTAGFYGAMTQAFLRVEARRAGVCGAMVIVPAVGHSLEWLVHRLCGTEELARSIGVSMAFTALSTSFTLFAMRHGVLVAGPGSRSLWDDLRAVPRLLVAFAAPVFRAPGGWL